MGQVREESAVINGVKYTTTTFAWSDAANLYVDLATVIPEEVMTIIMLPAANMLELKREEAAAASRAKASGEDPEEENPDEDPLILLRKTASVTVTKMLRMLETPSVLATITHTIVRESAGYPGGISALFKLILRQTRCNPTRIAPGMNGGEDDLVTHIDTHFDSDLMGMKDAAEVCVWVMRLNFVKPSSGGG